MEESVTRWIHELKQGDGDAAEKLWDHYFQRLVAVGRRSLRTSPRGAADEEDAALSAFNSFCVRAKSDGFERLNDRSDLWKLLTTITIRKSAKQARRENLRRTNGSDQLNKQHGPDLPPEFMVMLGDTTEYLLGKLQDPVLRQVATRRLEGLTNREIAVRIGRSIPTVERKLRLIREEWSNESCLDG